MLREASRHGFTQTLASSFLNKYFHATPSVVAYDCNPLWPSIIILPRLVICQLCLCVHLLGTCFKSFRITSSAERKLVLDNDRAIHCPVYCDTASYLRQVLDVKPLFGYETSVLLVPTERQIHAELDRCASATIVQRTALLLCA